MASQLPSAPEPEPAASRAWGFLTPHSEVLLAVARSSDLRVREIAAAADITERYAYQVLKDLETAGYIERRRRGRCNVYRIHRELAIGDPVVEERLLQELLGLLGDDGATEVVAMSNARIRRRTFLRSRNARASQKA